MLKRRNLHVSSFEKLSGGGGVVCLIIVSTPGPSFVRIKARGEIFKFPALKSLVVGWWGGGVGWGGGLFDYSVYSWPSFNQKWNLPMQGSG